MKNINRGIFIILVALTCVFIAPKAARAENMSVGVGADGNFYLVDGSPRLGPGVGGHIYFDYRFAPQLSAQFTIRVTTQDGTGPQAGDQSILSLAIPEIAFKYYLFQNSTRFDPYGQLGLGFHMVSEGSRGDGTLAFGLGANVGIGADFYLTPALSLNTSLIFHSIGMIGSTGANNGAGLFPLVASGGVAYHF